MLYHLFVPLIRDYTFLNIFTYITFRLEEPQKTELRPKSYAENFKFGRPDRWTH